MTATAAMWSILLVMLSSEVATRVVEGRPDALAADQIPDARTAAAPPRRAEPPRASAGG